MKYLYNLLKSFISFFWKYILIAFAFIAPIQPYLYCIYFLIFLDLLSGLYKAKKKGEPITSKRLKDTVTKLGWYTIPLLAVFAVDVCILKSSSCYLSRIVAGTISMIEVKSNFENASEMLGFDLWSMVRDKLTAYVNDKLKVPGNDNE